MHDGSGLHKNTPPVALSTRCVGIARLRDKYFPASNALSGSFSYIILLHLKAYFIN